MKWNDLLSFKKKFTNPPFLCLILAKEEEERKEILFDLLSLWQKEREIIHLNEGDESRFLKEVETFPFLAKERLVVVGNWDAFSQEGKKAMANYAKKPNSWVFLLVGSKGFEKNNDFYQTLQSQGEILDVSSGKPWEKEPELVRWLINEGEEEGVKLSQKVSIALIRAVAGQRAVLKRELEKLITFIGNRKEITLEDIRSVVNPVSNETVWELGDAIFAFDAKRALEIADGIEKKGEDIFFLIFQLRTQFRNALLALSFYQKGGALAVTEAFPYLKGGFLEKKLALFQGYGERKLKEGLLILFEAELKAKEGESICLLEPLIVQLATRL